MAGPQELGELTVCGAATVEVGTDSEDDKRPSPRVMGKARERANESRPFLLVLADREGLFELVDHEEHPDARRQRVEQALERGAVRIRV